MQQFLLPLVWAALAGPIVVQNEALADNATIRVAPLMGPAGEPIGEVTVRGNANATVVRIIVAPGGLAPGWHAVHFHAVGDCSHVDQFRSAKAILDQVAKNHGLLNAAGPKEGDLPNIYANADGSANAEVSSHAVRMLGERGLIERSQGSALIIHAGEDDHASQPVGNSGARVACADLK